MTTLEKEMEQRFIEQLTSDVSQWRYRDDIRTEADLWENLREKLNRSNLDILDGNPITDDEMRQVKDFLLDQAQSSYKAALWLAGEHRIAEIPVAREDASLGTIHLKAINNREIAGGNSCYEVINQYSSSKVDSMNRDRRFDVTLLINGLPMIHIELKNADHPFMDAFRQIKKYGEEGHFRGLMGLVQMFVVTNGVETRYIAADNRGNINEKFLTRWVNEDNVVVDDYLGFAKAALRIPEAHRMIGKYSVLDNDNKRLILLRPYQIHAIENIRKASCERQSGFIWHTTGSGKTLTSYTVTKNLLDIPAIDKTVFLIDRKDLDQQTSDAFMSYAENDDLNVRKTDNTIDLERKLSSKDRTAIVTTIQKMQKIIRKCTEHPEQNKVLSEKIRGKNIAFVVDECHRAVSPEAHRDISKFFGRSLWYGFTGTPLFDETARAQKGDLPRTTEQQYGPCLHKYTIKEAIKDQAVLGFMIQSLGIGVSEFQRIAVEIGLYNDESIQDVPFDVLEQKVVSAVSQRNNRGFYDDDKHRNEVIDYIINKSASKFKLDAPAGETYEAFLTCESIKEAQTYYRLFKEFIATGKVKEDIKKRLPDFPKIAITYSLGENEEGATADQEAMKKSLEDYNGMFGTSYSLENLGAYNVNLNRRLARKKAQYFDRAQQLDLVIVVDRLLTGFDAPCLSTIFLDRPPMKAQHLIQAFSRTNRLFNRSKRYGQIVTMQMPETYKNKIDKALLLYSNGSTSDVSAPPWEVTRDKLKLAVKELKQAYADIAGMELSTVEVEVLKKCAKSYQVLDRYLSEARVYDEFKEEDLHSVFGITKEKTEEYKGRYHNVIDELKRRNPGAGPEPGTPVDIEYELEMINRVEINYRYLVALIQSHIPEGDDVAKVVSPSEDKRITAYIEEYAKVNKRVAGILRTIWFEIRMRPEAFRGKDAFTLVQQRIGEILAKNFDEIAEKWCVNREELEAIAYDPSFGRNGKVSLKGDYDAYRGKGGQLSKLRYSKELRTTVSEKLYQEVAPLVNFWNK